MNKTYSFDKYKSKEEYDDSYTCEEGLHWDSPTDWLAIKKLKLCGCGMPEGNLEFVTALLALIDEDKSSDQEFKIFFEKRKNLFEEYKENVMEIIFHWLNELNILEHGSSVYGSWILDKEFFDDCCKWFHEQKYSESESIE
jgi:hypothetical protein